MFFSPLRDVRQSRGDELFSNKVPNSAHRWILPFLKWQRCIVNLRSSEECRAIGLNIYALLCYPLERKRGEGTNSVKVADCVSVSWVEGEKKKVPSEHSWNVWYFHQNIGFMACMEGFCGHYLTWITLGLNTSFSSAKHLVQGQCLALESHIAVWKTLLLRLRGKNTVLSWHIV